VLTTIASGLIRLPHGKEFLFVDEILSIDERHVIAARRVPEVEPWTAAHFPGNPIVPGVLLLEGMVQTAAVLGRSFGIQGKHRTGRLASVRSARFIQTVRPGARLIYYAEIRSRSGALHHFDAHTNVEGVVVAAASFVLALYRNARALAGQAHA